MNRKAVAVVLVLIILGTGSFLILFPRSSNSYHFEEQIPEGDVYRYSIWLKDIRDCTLNVSFIDDPDLLYNLDIGLYESHPEDSAFDLSITDYGGTYRIYQVSFEGKVRIRTIQLILGSGVPYEIVVSGSDVNSTFVYSNNAVGSDASLYYSATGSNVNLIFTENMSFNESGMEITVGSDAQTDYVNLYVDLPDGIYGGATFREPLYLQSNTGWAFRSQFIDSVTYSTDPLNPEPLLGFGIRAKREDYPTLLWNISLKQSQLIYKSGLHVYRQKQ